MTPGEQAMHDYIDAVQAHDPAKPETKELVRVRQLALRQHMVDRVLPPNLYQIGKKRLAEAK